MRLHRLLVLAPVTLALLAGCATVVDGTGTNSAAPSGSGPTDFPSSSGAPAPSGSVTGQPIPAPTTAATSGVPSPPASNDFSCPDVTFAASSLSFRCLTSTMRYSPGAGSASRVAVTVEQGTDWACEMSAGPYEGTAVSPLPITTDVRTNLVSNKAYGDSPTVRTDSKDSRSIDGRPAYVLASTITLNPTWAAKEKTKVRTEKLWVVAILTEPGKVSIWYASVPDLVKNLWSAVPAVIDAIKIV